MKIMETAQKKVVDFFLRETVWVFVTLILSYAFILSSKSNVTDGHRYFGIVMDLALVNSPILLWSYWRQHLKKRLRPWPYRLLWAAVFGSLLFFIGSMGMEINDLPFGGAPLAESDDANEIGLVMFWMVLTGTDLLLHLPWPPFKRLKISNWLSRITPARLGLVMIGFFSLMLMLSDDGFQRDMNAASDGEGFFVFFFGLAQVLLIYIPYYLLYHLHHNFLYRRILPARGLLYYLVAGLAIVLVFAPIHGLYVSLFPAASDWGVHIQERGSSVVEEEDYAVTLFVLVFSLPVILFIEWFRKTNAIVSLEAEKKSSELALLKEQVNPHFFFNTLNNLYAMSLTKAVETPETILQLSELMRYVIYQGKKEFVTLGQEVKYLRDYLNLQQIRLHKRADISFQIEVEDEELSVPPLLFIILVENAFKHGIEPAGDQCFLRMKLNSSDGRADFSCYNSIDPEGAEVHSGGLGIVNLRRRLELLFPHRHELIIEEDAVDYSVRLSFWNPISIP